MNWWTDVAQYLSDALALVLVFRLLSLRERKYGVFPAFCLFLGLQLVEGGVFFLFRVTGREWDYRLVWIIAMAFLWAVSLIMVYALAHAVLAELPGILRFSRILLNIVFLLAIIVAMATVKGEYWATGGARFHNSIDRILALWYVLDRAISMSALLILFAILAFILWFPVKMSKNLAIFSVGFVVYFGSRTALGLLRSYTAGMFRSSTIDLINVGGSLVLVLCFVYWLAFIDTKGQTEQVRIGHSWSRTDQRKLIDQLEAINLALVRQSQRL